MRAGMLKLENNKANNDIVSTLSDSNREVEKAIS